MGKSGRSAADTQDVMKGTLDMLILKALELEPMHGWGVADRIEVLSRGVFRLQTGTLLPGAASAAAPGTGRCRVADDRQRASGPLLPADGGRAEAAQHRARRMGPCGKCGQAHPERRILKEAQCPGCRVGGNG